ncbi:MAG: type II toxin-antitoxin system VapC family toxin [Thermoanaerobaculia bacterium]
MTYAVLVDTSAFYALQSSGDPREHALAVAEAARFDSDGALLVTSDYVLDETYTLLRSALGHRAAVRFGREIRRGGVEIAQVDPEIQDEAWRIFERYSDKDFSFTDCTSFAVMIRGRIELAFTLDRHFRQFGFETAPARPGRKR